jgi:hypothetical protein
MGMSRTESKALGTARGWTARKLTAEDVAKFSSQEFEWHTHWNRLNLQAATAKERRAVPTLAPTDQRETADKVLARFPQLVRNQSNADAINTYLRALQNPKMDASDVVKAIDELGACGQLVFTYRGREITGRELLELPANTFRQLLEPQTAEETERRRVSKLSSEQYKAENLSDWDAPTPDVIAHRFRQAVATVKQMPRFADLEFSHDDTQFLLSEMKARKIPFTSAGLAELIADNIERFTEVA